MEAHLPHQPSKRQREEAHEQGQRMVESPMTLSISSCQYGVLEAMGPPDPNTGIPTKLKVLQIIPSGTGLTINIPLPREHPEKLGNLLLGKDEEKIEIAQMLPDDSKLKGLDLSKLRNPQA